MKRIRFPLFVPNIDSAQQNLTVELAVVLRWKDPRLAHTGQGIVRYPLEQIWHPRLSIVHNKNTSPSRNLAYKGGLPKYPSDRIGSSV